MIYLEYTILFLLVVAVIYGIVKIIPAPIKTKPIEISLRGYAELQELPVMERMMELRRPSISYLSLSYLFGFIVVTGLTIFFVNTSAKFKKDEKALTNLKTQTADLETQLAVMARNNIAARKTIALLNSLLDSFKVESEYSNYFTETPGDVTLREGDQISNNYTVRAPLFQCISVGVERILDDSTALFNIDDRLSARNYQVPITLHHPFSQRAGDHAILIGVQNVDVAAKTVRFIPRIKSNVAPKACK